MTEELRKLIEEEARKYSDDHTNGNDSIARMFRGASAAAFKEGANFILSKWEESTRWRKVSEELPEDNERVLVKSKARRHYLSHYSKTNGFSSNANIISWKPIH